MGGVAPESRMATVADQSSPSCQCPVATLPTPIMARLSTRAGTPSRSSMIRPAGWRPGRPASPVSSTSRTVTPPNRSSECSTRQMPAGPRPDRGGRDRDGGRRPGRSSAGDPACQPALRAGRSRGSPSRSSIPVFSETGPLGRGPRRPLPQIRRRTPGRPARRPEHPPRHCRRDRAAESNWDAKVGWSASDGHGPRPPAGSPPASERQGRTRCSAGIPTDRTRQREGPDDGSSGSRSHRGPCVGPVLCGLRACPSYGKRSVSPDFHPGQGRQPTLTIPYATARSRFRPGHTVGGQGGAGTLRVPAQAMGVSESPEGKEPASAPQYCKPSRADPGSTHHPTPSDAEFPTPASSPAIGHRPPRRNGNRAGRVPRMFGQPDPGHAAQTASLLPGHPGFGQRTGAPAPGS